MLFEDLKTFVRRTNDNGTVSDIPKDSNNEDYRKYLRTVLLEQRTVVMAKADTAETSLKVMVADTLEGIGVVDAYVTLVLSKQRELGSVPEKWRDTVRSLVDSLVSDDELNIQEGEQHAEVHQVRS